MVTRNSEYKFPQGRREKECTTMRHIFMRIEGPEITIQQGLGETGKTSERPSSLCLSQEMNDGLFSHVSLAIKFSLNVKPLLLPLCAFNSSISEL